MTIDFIHHKLSTSHHQNWKVSRQMERSHHFLFSIGQWLRTQHRAVCWKHAQIAI